MHVSLQCIRIFSRVREGFYTEFYNEKKKWFVRDEENILVWDGDIRDIGIGTTEELKLWGRERQ